MSLPVDLSLSLPVDLSLGLSLGLSLKPEKENSDLNPKQNNLIHREHWINQLLGIILDMEK